MPLKTEHNHIQIYCSILISNWKNIANIILKSLKHDLVMPEILLVPNF